MRKAIAEEEYKETVSSTSASADDTLEDIKKLLAADIAARASMPAAAPAGETTTIAGPISGEVKLVADESLKSDLLNTIEKIMEENRKAQSKNTQTLAQFLSESQQKLAETLAQKTESGAWAESLAQVLSENKEGININPAAPAIDSGKLIDEIIEKQSSMFLEMSERQSDKLGTVLSSALQETNQASTKMIMDALAAFQKENTRLINMQEKIQRAILETEKRNSAPYSGFTLTTGNVSVNRDPSLDSSAFGGFGFNTGLGAFGSMGSNAAGSTNSTAAKPEEPKKEDKTEDEAAANFERLESLLSDADNLFKSDDESASKKKKKKKKKKNKNKEAEKNTDNENDIVVLFDDDDVDNDGHKEPKEAQTATEPSAATDEDTAPVPTETKQAAEPEQNAEWEYVSEAEATPSSEEETQAYDGNEYADYEYTDNQAQPVDDGYAATTDDNEWEYVAEDDTQAAGDGSQEWEYVNEDEAQAAGDDSQEWEYVNEDEAQAAGDDSQEWEYVSEDEAQADGDDSQEWEFVSEDEAQADGDDSQEWEYVSEDEDSANKAAEVEALPQPQQPLELTEIDPVGEDQSKVFNPTDDANTATPAESSEATMPTDVFNPLYGEQIQFKPMEDDSTNAQIASFAGLKLHEVSEFDNGSEDPYAPTTH